MAIVITRRRWLRQPNVWARPSQALSANLLGLINFFHQGVEAVGGIPLTVNGTVNYRGGNGGIGMQTASGGANNVLLPSVAAVTNATTVMMHWEKTAPTTFNSSSAWGTADASGTNQFQAHMPFSDGTVYFDFAGTSAGTSRLSVAMPRYDLCGMVFTVGARGMEIWRDGELKASNGGTPTRTDGGIGFQIGSGKSNSDDARFYAFGLWNVQQPRDVCEALSANPYIAFEARQPRFHFTAAATTFNSAWAAGANTVIQPGIRP